MYAIGFDIGGTKCAVSLGEIDCGSIRVLHRREIPTGLPQETMDELLTHAVKWKEEYGAESAGISCGGPLDSASGVIVSPPNLPLWHGFSIVDYVKEKSGLSAVLENDANACAVAEWKFGAGKGTKNMVFFTFGTGLGAGLILDGRLYGGANGNAGEFGHVRLAKNGPNGYGKDGSFEGFCSGGGISRLAAIMAKRRKKLPKCIEEMGGIDSITTKKLAEAAFAGDSFAKSVFNKSGEMLGKGLSLVIDIINPERIVIGGVFMRSGELLIPSMRREIEKEALTDSARVCEIVPASLSENVGDVAALAIAKGVNV
jgi:glucokinase